MGPNRLQNRVERIVLIQAVIGDAIIFVVVGANFSDREPVPTCDRRIEVTSCCS